MRKTLEDMGNEASAQGRAESILDALDCKSDMIPKNLHVSILAKADHDTLIRYLWFAAIASSMKEFFRQIA